MCHIFEGDGVPEKSKAEIRAQRRALQEAQRAAKQAKKDDKGGAGGMHSKEYSISIFGEKGKIVLQNSVV